MNFDTFCQHWKEPDCAFSGKRWAQFSTECCWHRTCRQHPAKGKVWRASRERCKAQTCSQHAQQFFFSEKYICFNLHPGRVSRMFSLSLEPSQAHAVAGDTEWGAEEARHTHRTRVLEFKLHKCIQISRWHTWVRQQPANPNSQHRHCHCNCHAVMLSRILKSTQLVYSRTHDLPLDNWKTHPSNQNPGKVGIQRKTPRVFLCC